MATEPRWTYDEMISETLAWWERADRDARDCRVVEVDDCIGEPCLIVLHSPSGATSDEAGAGGRWNLDGTAY